jgi:all-trans-retinol dehydrogenase (NAD+)
MESLAGKNVLITGAAGGIGRLMAEFLAEENCKIALLDVNGDLLVKTRIEIRRKGGNVFDYSCDISDEKSINTAMNIIDRDFEYIDILINNAGIVVGKHFMDMDVNDFKKVMNVNFFGMLMVTKKILPKMIKKDAGQIINIASSAGFIGMPKMSEYCASKFAVIGMSDALRMELKNLGKKNIKITVVCPYVIATGMFDGFKPLLFNPVLKPEKVAKKIVRSIKKKKPCLIIPFYLKYLYLLKVLPVRFQDWLLLLLGSGRAMEHFSGKQ